MASQDRKARPIRAQKAADFNRWRMPEMTQAERDKLIALAHAKSAKSNSSDPIELVEEPLHAEKLTLAEWEALREEARQEGLAQGREEGLQQGREEGLQQGMAEGLKQAEEQIQAKLAEVQALIKSLQQPLQQQEQELHQLLLKLCLKISGSLVEAEYAQRSDLLLTAIREALEKVPPGSGSPTLSLHPDDIAVVQPLADREGWELRENPNASRGDLQLVAGSCEINSELEQRLLQVAGTLIQRAGEGGGDESS